MRELFLDTVVEYDDQDAGTSPNKPLEPA